MLANIMDRTTHPGLCPGFNMCSFPREQLFGIQLCSAMADSHQVWLWHTCVPHMLIHHHENQCLERKRMLSCYSIIVKSGVVLLLIVHYSIAKAKAFLALSPCKSPAAFQAVSAGLPDSRDPGSWWPWEVRLVPALDFRVPWHIHGRTSIDDFNI